MADAVTIPIEDGGWMELPADDPRAQAYLARSRTPDPVYTVQRGDSLSSIAQNLLGNANLWPRIASLNGLNNPNLILVGQKLDIPLGAATGASNTGATSGPTWPSTSAPTRGATRPSSSAPSRGATGPTNTATGTFTVPLPAPVPAGGDSQATLAPARGFMFVIFEQLPEVGVGSKIIRKVALVPKNYAFPPIINQPVRVPGVGPIWPANPLGSISPADHVLNLNPAKSPFLSASDRAIGAPSIEGQALLVDVAKVNAAGGQVMTVEELLHELNLHVMRNPASQSQVNKLIWSISKIEGEVLIKGGIPSGAASPVSGVHQPYISSAEDLWQSMTRGEINQAELEGGLRELEAAYGRARVVGKVGRVLTVVSVVLTVVDLGIATNQSFERHTPKPLEAEAIRQIGGWGGAIAGVKIGAVAGSVFGIETGPGAIVTGALGAIIFGGLGYFGFDLIADKISPN